MLILLSLQADLALIQDPEFKKYVQLYKNDNAAFQKVRCAVILFVLILFITPNAKLSIYLQDFAAAWKKLIEFGVKF